MNSDELVERLRQHRVILKSGDYDGAQLMAAWCDMINAADRIQSLTADNAVLREAVERYMNVHGVLTDDDRAYLRNVLSQTGGE